MKVHFMSKKDDWGTPVDFFQKLHDQLNFTSDLCATSENCLLPRYVDDIESGTIVDKEFNDRLKLDWDREVFFCNPPYGRKLPKILKAVPDHARVVFLIPARTSTIWFENLAKRSDWILFLRHRIKFSGATHQAPFPSMLVGMNVKSVKGFSGLFVNKVTFLE